MIYIFYCFWGNFMFIFRNLFICAIFSILHASSAAASDPIAEIDSVRQIAVAFDAKILLVVDADETVSMVDCMPINWENGRQYKEEMAAAGIAFYQSKGGDLGDVAAMLTFRKKLETVFASQPLSYSLTEEAWVSFLDSVRKSGAQVIVVSSRRFKDEEPARIEFFESLGFKREELLYARRKKDVTLHEWLADKPVIKEIVFIDNLREHCREVTDSLLLQAYVRTTFVHNAYQIYFKKYCETILPLQLEAAYTEQRRLTDSEAIAAIPALTEEKE
jgi:hypothetical protein